MKRTSIRNSFLVAGLAGGIAVSASASHVPSENLILLHSRSNTDGSIVVDLEGAFTSSTGRSTVGGNEIGSILSSTFTSVVGAKAATFQIDIPTAGEWEVFATWGTRADHRAGIKHTVTHADGVTEVFVDQSATSNEWVSLGTFTFNEGAGSSLRVDNSNNNLSGSFSVDSVKLELIPEPSTYAAIFGGLALVGAAVYRRRLNAKS